MRYRRGDSGWEGYRGSNEIRFLGSADYQGRTMRRRIAMGKAATGGLTSIWKDRGVTMETKVKLVKVLVFPIVHYGAETWTMRKHERRKIDAFELWCWRRVLRVSWMERKTNRWIIENIKPEWTLESRVPKAALSYFGHMVRAGGMEDDVMLGRMNGARRRGRPRQRWLDTLMGYSRGATISNMRRYARDRAGWRGAATDVARSRMRLDGTRYKDGYITSINQTLWNYNKVFPDMWSFLIQIQRPSKSRHTKADTRTHTPIIITRTYCSLCLRDRCGYSYHMNNILYKNKTTHGHQSLGLLEELFAHLP